MAALQEVLKHYGTGVALGPVPPALAHAAHAGRKERRASGGNALLTLLPKDVQVIMLAASPRTECTYCAEFCVWGSFLVGAFVLPISHGTLMVYVRVLSGSLYHHYASFTSLEDVL